MFPVRDRREQIDGGSSEPTIRILQTPRHTFWLILCGTLSTGRFPNLAQADRAQEKLRHAGCGEEDVISVSGEEVVHFAQDHWRAKTDYGDS
jgi:hypothetical protein